MRARRSVLVSVLLLALAALLASCATNPVTGKREFMLMTESQELQLGASSDQGIVGQYGVVDDPALAAYVESIGQKMVPVSHRPDMAFTFRLLDDPVVNAFALPGGYVYITRGILAYLNSEAALAGVIGHEIGHVTARHSAQRYTQQAILGLGLGLGSALSETVARYAGVAGTAGQLLLLKYGRDDERQSDELGVQYATSIGYDTHDMAEFFHSLERLTEGAGRLPSWASTHPDPGERYATVHRLSDERQASAPGPFERNRDAFLRRLEGIVFGPNPRQGYVDGGLFLHPDLQFQFPVPEGWQVMNGSSQVALVAPEQDAAVLFTLGEGTNATGAADAFAQQEGITVLARENATIHGAPAVRIIASATASDGSVQRLLSTFVARDGRVYVFHGLSTVDAFAARRTLLQSVADGLQRLTDPAALNIQPVVLQVVESPRSGSFAQAVSGWPIPEGAGVDLAGLALMNGMDATTGVQRGQLLKVLRRKSASASR